MRDGVLDSGFSYEPDAGSVRVRGGGAEYDLTDRRRGGRPGSSTYGSFSDGLQHVADQMNINHRGVILRSNLQQQDLADLAVAWLTASHT